MITPPLALTPGTRLGPYEILSALWAGGIGRGLSRDRYQLEADGQKPAAPAIHLVLNWAEQLKAQTPAK